MKKFLTLLFVGLGFLLRAQDGFNYKILLSDNGNVLSNTSVVLRLSILDQSNAVVYQELHQVTTDAYGIARVIIGTGTSGTDFHSIDWSQPYNLKTEVSTDGGQNFTDFGTEDLAYVPYAKWAVSADYNLLKNRPQTFRIVGTTEEATRNTDTMYHLGPVVWGATGEFPGKMLTVYRYLSSSRPGRVVTNSYTGIFSLTSGNGDSNINGVYSHINVHGVGTKNAFMGVVSGDSTELATGANLLINNTGTGPHYGVFARVENGSGTQTGFYAKLTVNGGLTQMGSETLITGTGDAEHFGTYNRIQSSGNGPHYGYHAILEGSGSGDQTGIRSLITATGNGLQYGTYNELFGSGTGAHHGVFNYIHDQGDGDRFGVKNTFYYNGNGTVYGEYTSIYGTGSGDKYGLFVFISPHSAGNQYGVYSQVLKPGSYAGYFDGDVEITQRLTAPASGQADLKAYVYGSVAQNGQVDSSASSDGFSVVYSSSVTGYYRIEFSDNNVSGYSVSVTPASGSSPSVATVQKYTGYFIVRIYDLQGNARDEAFDFTVFKK